MVLISALGLKMVFDVSLMIFTFNYLYSMFIFMSKLCVALTNHSIKADLEIASGLEVDFVEIRLDKLQGENGYISTFKFLNNQLLQHVCLLGRVETSKAVNEKESIF